MNINQVLCGNSIEIMKNMVANSIDSIVVDGPYGLGFMGKEWDKFTSKEYQEFSFGWGSKAIQTLKPGGYCLSISAPKKYHRMACGLEDAGFKIKDMINWVFGSGFPKSLDISKAINKIDGIKFEEKPASGVGFMNAEGKGGYNITKNQLIQKEESSNRAKQWVGWGTGLKPAQEPIVLAQKPCEGTYAENVLKWGVGGLYIDGCRIDYLNEGEDSRVYNESTNVSRGTHKNGTVNIAPDGNEMRMFKPNKGRWPTNFILTHHPECVLIGSKEVGSGIYKSNTEIHRQPLSNNSDKPFNSETCGFKSNKSTAPSNYGKQLQENYECHPDCPVRMIDEQSGNQPTSFRPNLIGKNYESDSMFGQGGNMSVANQHNDRGGASRFFYCAKAYRKERNLGCEDLYWEKIDDNFKKITKKKYDLLPSEKRAKGNLISTLKPINLIRYLVRLVTPLNGLVLDPFAGSGTLGIACIIENFNYILIEKRKPFAEIIIPKRLKYWENPDHWKILKDHPLLPKIQIKIKEKQNMSLEAWA